MLVDAVVQRSTSTNQEAIKLPDNYSGGQRVIKLKLSGMSKSRINQLDLPSVGVVYDISQYQLPAINEEQLDQDEGAVNGDNDENQFQDACENKIEAYVVNIQRSFNPAEESGSDYETADEDQSAKLIGPEDNNVGFNFQSVSREGAPDGHEIPLLTVPYFQHLSEFDSEENAPYINSLKSRKV